MTTTTSCALGDHGQHEQRNGDAQRVEQRHEERGCPDVMVRGRHRYCRQNRSGAGHEDEAEAQAQNEAAAFVGVARGTQSGERSLNDLAESRDEQAHRQEARAGRRPSQNKEILGQVEEAEQRAGEEDGDAETHDQPGNDHVGPPLARSGRSARHDDRNDGNDAGGQPGDQSAEKRDDQEFTHGSRAVAVRERALVLLLRKMLGYR